MLTAIQFRGEPGTAVAAIVFQLTDSRCLSKFQLKLEIALSGVSSERPAPRASQHDPTPIRTSGDAIRKSLRANGRNSSSVFLQGTGPLTRRKSSSTKPQDRRH